MTGSQSAFQKEQNKFRGVIAKYRSTEYRPKAIRTPLSCLRSDIKEIYLGARESLHPSMYQEFFTWTKKQLLQVPEVVLKYCYLWS